VSDPLDKVRAAAKAKRRAENRYRAALVHAVHELEDSGDTGPYVKVAQAAGVSRQAVRELVLRSRRL
jgi:hypothetical protein